MFSTFYPQSVYVEFFATFEIEMHLYMSIEYLYLAINKGLGIADLGPRNEDRIMRIKDRGLRIEDRRMRIED